MKYLFHAGYIVVIIFLVVYSKLQKSYAEELQIETQRMVELADQRSEALAKEPDAHKTVLMNSQLKPGVKQTELEWKQKWLKNLKMN